MKKYDPNKHHRRSIRLKDYDYSQPGAYFITICTHNRECIFGEIKDGKMILNVYGEIVEKEWLRTSEIRQNVIVDEFVIMPNHIHGILIITCRGVLPYARTDVLPYARTDVLPYASKSSQKNRDVYPLGVYPYAPTFKSPSKTIGSIIRGFKSATAKQINQLRNTPSRPLWQRNYYEHIVRNETALNKIRQYIINNPLKWELDIENPQKIKEYKDTGCYFKEVLK